MDSLKTAKDKTDEILSLLGEIDENESDIDDHKESVKGLREGIKKRRTEIKRLRGEIEDNQTSLKG